MQGSSDIDAETAPTLPPQVAEPAKVAEPDDRRRAISDQTTVEDDGATTTTTTTTSTDPAAEAGSAASADVGDTIVSEARELVSQRRFAEAARVLESAQRLRPDDPHVMAMVALVHAHRGRRRQPVRDALARLSTDFGSQSVTWRAVADVALARFQFDPAQQAARTAVQMAPRSTRNWHTLAAAYAGNGWFDEANECLSEARQIDPVGVLPGNGPLDLGQWQIGRAVNHWALSRTYIAMVSVLAFVYLGLLGLALALSTPMLVREIRVRRLPEPFQTLADLAWRDEHRLRILNAIVVMGVLVAWVVVFSITR